jgi:hypothetical protein
MLRETSAANTSATSTACAARADAANGPIAAAASATTVAEMATQTRTPRIEPTCETTVRP